MRDTQRQRHRQREKQAPSGEPDVGLDSRTPGSQPEPKAGAKPLRHPGIPALIIINATSFHIQHYMGNSSVSFVPIPHFFTYSSSSSFFKKDFIYLFMRDRERERGRGIGRGRSRLHAGSPMWDSGITPWAKGKCSTAEQPSHPYSGFF